MVVVVVVQGKWFGGCGGNISGRNNDSASRSSRSLYLLSIFWSLLNRCLSSSVRFLRGRRSSANLTRSFLLGGLL